MIEFVMFNFQGEKNYSIKAGENWCWNIFSCVRPEIRCKQAEALGESSKDAKCQNQEILPGERVPSFREYSTLLMLRFGIINIIRSGCQYGFINGVFKLICKVGVICFRYEYNIKEE
jgi:hypothetical protein